VILSRGAEISDCGLYRYWLTRSWIQAGEQPRVMTFCLLNPSTADAMLDDPTVRRCVGFAQREGCNALRIVNLYALRSTDPQTLWSVPDPVGPRNSQALQETMTSSRLFVCGWGRHARPDGLKHLRWALSHADQCGFTMRLHCLGTNKDGSPKHPLYIKADQPLVPWVINN
jgi:hypothetical protein